MRKVLIPIGCVGLAAVLGVASGMHSSGEATWTPSVVPAEDRVTLEVELPEPPGGPGKKENCDTGCTLKKHQVPPFTIKQFHAALAAYAKAGVDEPTPALERLLFYGRRTVELIEDQGTGPLPKQHVKFLRRELARNRAVVSIRMVDAAGHVRVNLAPVTVPIGIKQHLKPPALDGSQPLEINGTVMRTGLYHLWSRY